MSFKTKILLLAFMYVHVLYMYLNIHSKHVGCMFAFSLFNLTNVFLSSCRGNAFVYFFFCIAATSCQGTYYHTEHPFTASG